MGKAVLKLRAALKDIYLNLRLAFCPQISFKSKLLKVKEIIGYYPNDLSLYETAFVHCSATYTSSDENHTPINNERLEYLGDAILGAIVADLLYHKFPQADEGFLTQMRSRIVSRQNLNKVAKEIDLDKLMISNLGKGSRKNIFGDAFEALVGAIYLDKGYKTAESFVINRIINNYINLEQIEKNDTNYKSQLIEWAQKYKKEVNFDTKIDEEDQRYFISHVIINEEILGSGSGKSKKEAEQNAAHQTLNNVDDEEVDEDEASELVNKLGL